MSKKNILLIVFLILGFFACGKTSLASTETNLSPSNLRIFYYVPGVNARQSFYINSQYIDVIAPQVYVVDQSGNVTGSVEPGILAYSAQKGIKVMPLLTESYVGQTATNTFLLSPALQTNAINALVAQAKTYGYWGYQVDFESIPVTYRDNYTAFIQRMYTAFKENNLELSVAVIAQVSDNPLDYKNNLWQRAIGLYDYGALASSTDLSHLWHTMIHNPCRTGGSIPMDSERD